MQWPQNEKMLCPFRAERKTFVALLLFSFLSLANACLLTHYSADATIRQSGENLFSLTSKILTWGKERRGGGKGKNEMLNEDHASSDGEKWWKRRACVRTHTCMCMFYQRWRLIRFSHWNLFLSYVTWIPRRALLTNVIVAREEKRANAFRQCLPLFLPTLPPITQYTLQTVRQMQATVKGCTNGQFNHIKCTEWKEMKDRQANVMCEWERRRREWCVVTTDNQIEEQETEETAGLKEEVEVGGGREKEVWCNCV